MNVHTKNLQRTTELYTIIDQNVKKLIQQKNNNS